MSASGLKLLSNGRIHAVRYILYDNVDRTDRNIFRVKPGISQLDSPNQYYSQTLRTDGSMKMMFRWDDDYIDQSLTYEQAAEIVKRADTIFKTMMEDEGYNSRKLNPGERIGTEYVEAETQEEIIEVIELYWDRAYRVAYEYVTKTELPDAKDIPSFKPRPGQDTEFINPIIDFLKENDRCVASAPGGSGKTKMSFYISQNLCELNNKAWKLLAFTNSRSNTEKLALEYSKFYKSQTGRRNLNIIIVGSVDGDHYRVLESWASVYSASDSSHALRRVLRRYYNTEEDCAIFVVNKSAYNFLALADRIGMNFKDFFTIQDEVHDLSTENGQYKLITSEQCAVVNPRFDSLFGKKLSLSATLIYRPTEIENPLACFNDDQVFGKIIVNIDEIRARKLNWICDKEALIVPIPSNEGFVRSIEEKRPFELNYREDTIQINPVSYVAIESLMKYIIPSGKTHILLLVTFRRDVQSISELLKKFQEYGDLDSEYEILEGKAERGYSIINRFNKSKKSIMIATRWIGVGNDTYRCDCFFPLYTPTNEWFRRQSSMRADRIYYDKISLMVLCEFEERLRDNGWYGIVESISNGHIPNIISASSFDLMNGNEIERIGSFRNPPDGTSLGNITLIRSENHNPILFAQWEALTTAIAARQYTDEYGNSRFSDIVRRRMEIVKDEIIKECKEICMNDKGKTLPFARAYDTIREYINSKEFSEDSFSNNGDSYGFIRGLIRELNSDGWNYLNDVDYTNYVKNEDGDLYARYRLEHGYKIDVEKTTEMLLNNKTTIEGFSLITYDASEMILDSANILIPSNGNKGEIYSKIRNLFNIIMPVKIYHNRSQMNEIFLDIVNAHIKNKKHPSKHPSTHKGRYNVVETMYQFYHKIYLDNNITLPTKRGFGCPCPSQIKGLLRSGLILNEQKEEEKTMKQLQKDTQIDTKTHRKLMITPLLFSYFANTFTTTKEVYKRYEEEIYEIGYNYQAFTNILKEAVKENGELRSLIERNAKGDPNKRISRDRVIKSIIKNLE
jgi:hypothetical protein